MTTANYGTLSINKIISQTNNIETSTNSAPTNGDIWYNTGFQFRNEGSTLDFTTFSTHMANSNIHINKVADRIAIGYNAGLTSQGQYSLALGYTAGVTNQHTRTIAISGTNTTLNTDRSDALFINPIRNAVNSNTLKYNTSTKEITYDADIAPALHPINLTNTGMYNKMCMFFSTDNLIFHYGPTLANASKATVSTTVSSRIKAFCCGNKISLAISNTELFFSLDNYNFAKSSTTNLFSVVTITTIAETLPRTKNNLIFDGEKFLLGRTGVTGAQERILYSYDGITWSTCSGTTDVSYITSISYNTDYSVYIASGGTGTNSILRSVDRGLTWTSVSGFNASTGSNIYAPTRGKFYISGAGGFAFSVLGSSWTIRYSAATIRPFDYSPTSGRFLSTLTSDNNYYRATDANDGDDWTVGGGTSGGSGHIYNVQWIRDTFVAILSNTVTTYGWTRSTTGADNSWTRNIIDTTVDLPITMEFNHNRIGFQPITPENNMVGSLWYDTTNKCITTHNVLTGNNDPILYKKNITIADSDITLDITHMASFILCPFTTQRTITIPQNIFPVGCEIEFFLDNIGSIAFDAGIGVTTKSTLNFLVNSARNTSTIIKQVSTNTWVLLNNLSS
jgi:hypothetical protein